MLKKCIYIEIKDHSERTLFIIVKCVTYNMRNFLGFVVLMSFVRAAGQNSQNMCAKGKNQLSSIQYRNGKIHMQHLYLQHLIEFEADKHKAELQRADPGTKVTG